MRIIAGRYRYKLLKEVKGGKTRPTTAKLRGQLFDIFHDIEGERWLDLFAGSGAVGLEALSRCAAHVVFVEKDRRALTTLRANIAHLNAEEQTTVLAGDIFAMLTLLARKKQCFDKIFADPPYHKGHGGRLLKPLASLPLLRPGGIVALEENKECPLAPRYNDLYLQSQRRCGSATLFLYQQGAPEDGAVQK